MNDQYLTKADILGCEIRTDEIRIPQWGNKLIRYRELTAEEHGKIAARIVGPDRQPDMEKAMGVAPMIVCWCAQTADGDPMFTENDLPALRAARGNAVNTLGKAIMTLSGMADVFGDNGQDGDGETPAGDMVPN